MKINRNHALIAAAGAGIIAIGGAGYLLGRNDPASPPPAAEKQEEAGHEEAEGEIEMDAAGIASSDIELLTITSGSLGSEIIAQASITATPQGQAAIAARADGAVTRILVRIGDNVRAGQTLAVLESREASTIAAERSAAQAKAVAARSAYARERRLFEAKITAREALEAAQANLAEAEAELRRTNAAAAATRVTGDGRSIAVTSPIAGRVTSLPATLGAFVPAGTELVRVTNPALIQVEAAVPATEARRIAPGDAAELETPSGRIAASVRSISPAADPESRAVTVVLTLQGSGALAPGQSVRARIVPSVAGASSNAIVVPEEAVQTVEGKEVVFVRTGHGFRAVEVTTGQRSGGRVEIRSGLRPGWVIAARNAFVLKSEAGKSEAGHEH